MTKKNSRKGPDMRRNEVLAGRTVYSHGMNVTYDERGYAVKSVNPDAPNYRGTTMSVRAQPIEDALSGRPWTEPDLTDLVDWNGGSPDYSKRIGDAESGGPAPPRGTGGKL